MIEESCVFFHFNVMKGISQMISVANKVLKILKINCCVEQAVRKLVLVLQLNTKHCLSCFNSNSCKDLALLPFSFLHPIKLFLFRAIPQKPENEIDGISLPLSYHTTEETIS